jgi:hypothetical protein
VVALTRNNKGKLSPMLLTTSNLAKYALHRYRFPGLLPASIACLTYAEPIDGSGDANQPPWNAQLIGSTER